MQQKEKWYQKTAGIIILLLLFWPIGLFLMWKHSNWKKVIKVTISVVFGILCIAVILTTDNTETQSTTTQVVQEQTPTETVAHKTDTNDSESSSDELDAYLSTLSALYDELNAEYNKHLSNFVPADWAAFRREHNEKIDSITVPNSVSVFQGALPANIKILGNAYGRALDSRGDSDHINLLHNDIQTALNE